MSKEVSQKFRDALLLQPPEHRWECPNCDLKDVTREVNPHTRFHSCSGLANITAPMVPAGTRCEVKANVREDYVGDQEVQYDNYGRPIMSITTTRDDGQDCAVLAPCAGVRGEVQ